MRSGYIFLLISVAACGTKPAGAGPAPQSSFSGDTPLNMTMRGSSYAGSAILTHVRGDSVTGTFKVVGPGTVQGTLSGRVTKNDIALDFAYAVVENGCKGTIHMTGPVANNLAQGSADAQDSCVGKMNGTFKLGKS